MCTVCRFSYMSIGCLFVRVQERFSQQAESLVVFQLQPIALSQHVSFFCTQVIRSVFKDKALQYSIGCRGLIITAPFYSSNKVLSHNFDQSLCREGIKFQFPVLISDIQVIKTKIKMYTQHQQIFEFVICRVYPNQQICRCRY